MKSTSKLISFLAIATLSLTGVANAKNKAFNLIEKSVNAKCYVELVGGGETISLWLVKPSLLNKLAGTIVGQEVLVLTRNQQGANKGKSTIYRAKQCVLAEGEFQSARARAMDEDLPR